ncbi:DUF3820 family protein [Salegentibacter sp.]|uniref:DUF3820 family protein n=1 Tax=Salegentibacter sp. TaxID=1903072 RepID=UPI00356A9F19
MNPEPSQKALIELAYAKMYFGKYKGYFLSDVPEYYFVWYRQKGFPPGKTGEQMQQVFELKLNGMEGILREIRRRYPKRS